MRLDARDLRSDRLVFEPFGAHHLDLLRSHEAAEDMWKWMPACEGGASMESHVTEVVEAQRRGLVLAFVIRLVDSGDFAGCAAYIEPNRSHRRVRIGYVWHPAHLRGTGIFRAGQLVMLDRAFAWGAKRVEWLADTRNGPALSAISGLGASQEGVLRQWQRLFDGSWSDVALFSMLRQDWPPARQSIVRSLHEMA